MTDPEGMERVSGQPDRSPSLLLCPAGFPVPAGTKEWVLAKGERGEKGEKGTKGDQGERGMPPAQRRAIVYLFLLNMAFIVLGFLWLAHIQGDNDAYQARQHATEVRVQKAQQAASQKAGQHVLHLLCLDLGTMANIAPPTGNPAANPSRAYEDAEHRAWTGLDTGLGCH